MKKHSYRQVDIAKLDWTVIRARTENHAIIFSVDVAKNMFVGALFTKEKELISPRYVTFFHLYTSRLWAMRKTRMRGFSILQTIRQSPTR